jgi:hypothetical protein
MNRRLGIVLLGVLVAAGGVPAPVAAQTTQVIVDGQRVFFDQPPAVIGGRMLVPLRGVFERLGAAVEWTPATNTVRAARPGAEVQLTVGLRQAVVNGRAVLLDVAPMIVGGRTLVPLRFVSEAMGARVDWDPATAVVYITSAGVAQPVPIPPPPPAPLPAPVPPPAAPPASSVVEGVVFRVDALTVPPRIHVQRGNIIHAFEVTADTTITRIGADGRRGVVIELDQVQQGDVVRVTADVRARAILIRVEAREATGRIDALTPRSIVLANGQSFRLSDGVRFFIDGREVSRAQLRPGMEVSLRLLSTGEVIEVAARGAQAAPPGPAVRIQSLTHNAARPLRAGARLTVTLRGTPGGEAAFDIFGVAGDLPMQETAPGLYTGTYTVRAQDNVVDGVVQGHLRVGTRVAPIVHADTPVTIDTLAPRIVRRLPDRGQTVPNVRPNIMILIEDPGGSGINTDAVRLIVNGRDVSGRAAVTAGAISYNPPEPLFDRVSVRVILADLAGNTTDERYDFFAAVSQGALVRSVTVHPTIVRVGDVLTVSATGEPGGRGTFSVQGIAQDIPMTEAPNQPGTYLGTYRIRPQDAAATDARVTVLLRRGTASGQAEASARVTVLGADRVAAPVITSPEPGRRLGDPIVVRGTAPPGHRVVVRVDYQGSVLLFSVRGTYGQVSTTADDRGQWAVSIPRRGVVADAELTITAVAIDPLGRESEPTVLRAVASR